MDKYDQPAGLIEGSPGLFYGISGAVTTVGFTITPQGSMTILTSFPSGYHFGSLFAAGPNGRLYSSVQLRAGAQLTSIHKSESNHYGML